MICLCCGKPILEDATSVEKETGWHRACVKRFFGTSRLPEIDIDDALLEQLAVESTNQGLTVPGIQKKLSLHLTTGREPRLTLVNYPTGFILKPQTEEYPALPEAEHLIMRMAEETGIRTVPFALLRTPMRGGSYAYITRRVDRVLPKGKTKELGILAMEDFCQLDRRLTQDKYRGSYERCARVIERWSAHPGLDLSELFLRLVFSYAVGNSDMHLKNFSLIETAPESGVYVLSDAYDLLPVNVILPEDKEQFALTMNGKKRNLRRKDFMLYAQNCSITEKTADRLIQSVVDRLNGYIELCRASILPGDMKEKLESLMIERCDILSRQ